MANDPTPPIQTGTISSPKMIVAMGSVGLIASILLVVTYQITAPHIARNRAEYLERAIFEVLPAATQKTTFARTEDDGFVALEEPGETTFNVYAGYDEQGTLVGVAIEAQGQGYQDVIRIIYGYAPECACVVGMKVLESKETPGLGDKIEKDPAFRANFDALDVQLASDRNRLLHDVELVKKGSKTEAWHVEAITGATISSRAIARIIQQSASEIIPVIDRNLTIFREGL
ncbi:MAG: FMN-binding protein [Rhodothermales bacterium]